MNSRRCNIPACPQARGLIVEPMENGVTIRYPPVPVLKAILSCLFAALMLFPMTAGIVYAVCKPDHLVASDLPPIIFMGLVVVTFWPVVIIVVWQSFHRRRVPTICTVNGPTLVIITPDQPKLRARVSDHARR